jgi:hypothetical protein
MLCSHGCVATRKPAWKTTSAKGMAIQRLSSDALGREKVCPLGVIVDCRDDLEQSFSKFLTDTLEAACRVIAASQATINGTETNT